MKKHLSLVAFVGLVSVASAANTGVSIFDDSFSLFNGTSAITAASPDFEVLWGTYSGTTFTPFLGAAHTAENDGYVGDPFGVLELSSTLALASNAPAAVGTPLALAITMISDGGDYVAGTEIVLTDPSWLMPQIDPFAAEALAFSFTSNTVAQKGLFTFSAAGSDTLNFVAVPEPSSFAALAGLAVLGLAASRRRRA